MTVTVKTFEATGEAAQALSMDAGARFLGGGTFVMRGVNEGRQDITSIIVSRDAALTQVRPAGGHVEIGARVTMAGVLASPELSFLHGAARVVGGPAIRTMASVGGNMCARSPYGDFTVALLALDAKVTLDGNAEFRHPEWDAFRGLTEMDDREKMAAEKDLQYIGLDGTVGIIANGAGLAMSTLDVVNQVGGAAANFLDIGGGANADVMAGALEVINFDENVKSIFINIFGGITRGEEVAKGIVEALGRVDMKAPIVIRLDGTNADEGREILRPHLSDSLMMEDTMLSAAGRAVELAS